MSDDDTPTEPDARAAYRRRWLDDDHPGAELHVVQRLRGHAEARQELPRRDEGRPVVNGPLRLPDGSLVVPPRYAATVFAACETALQLDPQARNAPLIRARLRAVINAAGNTETPPGDARENSEMKFGSAEAAQILGVGPRRVCQLGEQIGGRQLPNGRWEFDAVTVYEAAARRGKAA